MSVQLIIDREFRDLCPSSSDDELLLLRESIRQEGCRDPIIYWENGDNEILDGHQRHTICQQEKKKFDTRGIKLSSRDSAKQWILRNQLSRRNLTEVQRKIIRGRLYNSIKGSQGGDNKAKGNSCTLVSTSEGVSERTVKNDGKLAEAVDRLAAPVAHAIEQGEIPMKDAAALACLPKAEQREVLKAVESGEVRNVTEAIGDNKPVERKIKPGSPIFDVSRFKEVYDYIGKFTPKLTKLNKEYPFEHYRKATDCVGDLLGYIKDWEKSCRQ